MTKLTVIAAGAFVALVASTSFASAMVLTHATQPNPPNTPNAPTVEDRGIVGLECRVKGTDFYVINFGTMNVDSGRQVAWNSPRSGDSGVVMLPRMLAPGEELRLSHVLSTATPAGSPCSAGFV